MSKISRKLLRQADEQARLAEKIYNYRCDVLETARREALRANIDKVEELKDDRELADEAVLRDAMTALEAEMKASGGSFYPKSSLTENVEVMLVAAILAICIRMFFVQPFRIPTNSMYPTYDGMTYELFATPEAEPGALETAFRTITLCSSRVTLTAPADGEVIIPVFPTQLGPDGYAMIPKAVAARKWFGILPTTNAEFTVLVGEEAVKMQVPVDFHSQVAKIAWERFGAPGRTGSLELARGGVWLYHTGYTARKGEDILCFDILLGDQLFVDRVSYHFRRPRVGDPIVFRTDMIGGMPESERGKYYIKRLVGLPGDNLLVKAPVLLRNGAPIEGADAFALNAAREGEYEGYLATLGVRELAPLTEGYIVPEGYYFGMGDNSDESSDSRVWGPMPMNAVVGKALVIYYPFTNHVGAAK